MVTAEQLQAIFDFSAEELNLNRNGILSSRQTKIASKKYKTIKLVLLIVALPLVLVGILMISIGLFQKMLIGLAIGGGFMLLLTLPLAYFGIRPVRKLSVQVFSGPIKLARVQRSHRTNDTVNYYTATELHIIGKAFTIPDPAYSFLTEGEKFTIYAENDADHIFSIELIS